MCARRFVGVYQQHGFVHVTSHESRKRFKRPVYTLVNGNSVIQRWFFKHPVDDLRLVSGMAYAQAQTPIVAGAKLGVNVPQAVMAGVAAAEFEFDLPRGDAEFIMGDQNFLRRNFEKSGKCSDRFPGKVHEGLWL